MLFTHPCSPAQGVLISSERRCVKKLREYNAVPNDVAPPMSVIANVTHMRSAPEVLAGSILIVPFIFSPDSDEYPLQLNATENYDRYHL